ncbi:GGDEF domain-containing protein [Sphingomonas bacterium]|uniref:GGDEF domain-containing protein n=1 Tax=Sphingomonas bacterium TaxID=1895847 RepID=UPI0020C6EE6C|nr:diguanylate cyclase [Sphingomonas bacterium]
MIRGAWRYWWMGLAVALALLPCSAPAAAQAGLVGTPISVCVKRVAANDRALALLTDPRGFDCVTDQRRFGPGDFWVVSRPFVTDSRWPARIRVVSTWQRSATLWARYADGAVRMLPGDGRATTRRLQLGAIVEYKLPSRAVPVTRLLWHVLDAANARGLVLAPHSASPAESAMSNMLLAGLYGCFVGLCLSLFIYNLALFAALRHRFQLAYCVMVASLLVYALSSSGALAWLAPNITNNDRVRISYLSLAVSAVAALAFARAFFEPRVFAGALGRAADAVTALLIGSAVLFAVLEPWHARLLGQLCADSFAALMLIAPAALWRAWRQRSNYLWLFGLAWAVPIALATLRVAGTLGLTGWSFWMDNSTLLAMALEAVTSALAIAYRVHLLSRERDEAREQEMAARLLADTDPLTGLLNRRAFLAQAIGREGDQCLLILDVDHFKRVNETIGHDGGDEVLRVIARSLRAAAPPGALVARFGGEEFVTVCSADAAPLSMLLLERLRTQRMPYDMTVTSSIGSCTGPLMRETDWKRLYREADRALFAAKAAGRDRARDATQLTAAA